MIRLEVAVAAPLDQTLAYLYAADIDDSSCGGLVGRRVLVPLGKRRVTGYVLGSLPDQETDYIVRPVLEVLDRQPLFHQNCTDFFRWIASYYHFPIGEVIKTALPAGLLSASAKKILLTDLGRNHIVHWFDATGTPPDWVDMLLSRGSLSTSICRKIMHNRDQKKMLAKLQHLDYVCIIDELQGDSVKEKEEVCYRLCSDLPLPDGISAFDPRGLAAFRKLLEQGRIGKVSKSEARTLYTLGILGRATESDLVPKKELIKGYPGAAGAIPGLLDKRLVIRSVDRIYRNPFGSPLAHFPRPESLTEEQEQALGKIVPAIQSKRFHAFLLYGVTGSGKTEVYLQAAEQTLESGRDVIVLVPEIALATQLEAHFVSRFNEQVVLLHSGLSAGERFDQWCLAAAGKARIVIGARSAIFAPLLNPGLIVVDEEHDAGYKQDDSLRYQGRDLAVLRARNHDAIVLLGSATPSVTSYYHAMTGKYTLLQMTRRVAGRSLPEVAIVDLRKRSSKRMKGIFSPELFDALTANLERNNQSLLLMNRRGFSSTVLCQECGTPVECRHCHVSLVYHKNRQRLICHYCGYSLPHRLVCSKCGSDALVPMGFGTERIQEEVQSLFPAARVARLDSDTAADRKKFIRVLKAMQDREIDILVGTQMIAKGHHFPNVTLVGVVWADGGLNMPDFRAAERTFQLISQVTGRAGRGENPGRVFVQTMQPDHYSIVFSREHRYRDLYDHEMEIRKMPCFPPFVRMIAFLIHGPDEADVRKTASEVARRCLESIGCGPASKSSDVRDRPEILGPAPAPLDRLRDQYRWQVVLKGMRIDELHRVCNTVMARIKRLAAGSTRISVDVDPENMM